MVATRKGFSVQPLKPKAPVVTEDRTGDPNKTARIELDVRQSAELSDSDSSTSSSLHPEDCERLGSFSLRLKLSHAAQDHVETLRGKIYYILQRERKLFFLQTV